MTPKQLVQYQRLEAVAASRGGRLISEAYLGSCVNLEFEDAAGRRFHCCPGHIFQGIWSPAEKKNRRDPEKQLARLREIALAHGGRLISTVYKNNSTKLEFEDADGNRFHAPPFNVLRGIWSPYEAKLVRDPAYHLAELARIAETRGGRLISTEYHGWNVKLEFEDAAGNRFRATSNNVKKGRWSPHDGLVSEPVCRQAMEHLFGAKFPSRWDVVRRPNGNKLQLDGYNETLKVAFEYQGFFHGREDVQARDADKKTACIEAGILLVAVPEFRPGSGYRADYVLDHVETAILDACAEASLKVPRLFRDGFSVDLMRINHCIRMREEVAERIRSKGGELLSDIYVDDATQLEIRDENGVVFWMSARGLKQGSWSREANARSQALRHLTEVAQGCRLRGGRLLSDSYVNSTEKLEVLDVFGNPFAASSNSLKSGQWSPWESHLKGATRIPSPDGRRAMRLASGATVAYDILPDGTHRIREAVSPDGITRRRWAWNRAVPVIGTAVLDVASGDFHLAEVHNLDGSPVPMRSWTSGALSRTVRRVPEAPEDSTQSACSRGK